MNQSPRSRIALGMVALSATVLAAASLSGPRAHAARGVLTLTTRDETTNQTVPARLELTNPAGRKPALRRTASSGPGVILDRSLDLTLPDGQYRFRLTRGPEYRVVSGDFSLERTAEDERLVTLPRMVDMQSQGYLSGDMAVADSTADLPLRMAAEDLHVVAVIQPTSDQQTRAGDLSAAAETLRDSDPSIGPLWVGQRVSRCEDLLFYPADPLHAVGPSAAAQGDGAASAALVALQSQSQSAGRVAIAYPFAWQLPVWLASERIDGMFVLGEWLREGAPMETISSGRPPREIGFGGPQGPGRYAEAIYWRLLEAGFSIAPLAGTGTQDSAVGYNRVYAIGAATDPDDDRQLEPIVDQQQWYEAVWSGRSMITNGPLLRPTLGGQAPGHRFKARDGEVLQLSVELHLAVRDPVDYLEVIHNGEVFYSARLDEFAEAGGVIPELKIDRSGWVLVRVVTGYEDHFRAAMSAPWYIDFADSPRISRKAVMFFGHWLNDCETELKKLPAQQLAAHIEPVKMARAFWKRRLQAANAD